MSVILEFKEHSKDGTCEADGVCPLHTNWTSDMSNGNGKYVGVMTPRLALGGEVLQASLTISPSAHTNYVQRTVSRYSVSHALHPHLGEYGNGATYPARHSKSLDQLELSLINNAQMHDTHDYANRLIPYEDELLEQAELVDSSTSDENGRSDIECNNFKFDHKVLERTKSTNGVYGNRSCSLKQKGCSKAITLDSISSQKLHHNESFKENEPSRNPRCNGKSELYIMRSERIVMPRHASLHLKKPALLDKTSLRGTNGFDKLNISSSSENEPSPVRKVNRRRRKLALSSSVPLRMENFNGTAKLGSESLPNLLQNILSMPPSESNGRNNQDESTSDHSPWSDKSLNETMTPYVKVRHQKNHIYRNGLKLENIKCEQEDDFFEIKPLPERHLYISKEAADKLPHNAISTKNFNEKSKSEFNLNLLTPPDQFRDPPTCETSSSNSTDDSNKDSELVDDDDSSCRAMMKSHSNRDLSAASEFQCVVADEFNDQSEQSKTTLPLMEFEKCRNEFRKQIKYSGQMYCDFTKFASEVPYFHTNEFYTQPASGVHLIVCVHGLDGSAGDLRLIRAFLELGLADSNLEFLMSECNQGDTFSDFETLADR